MSGGAARLDDVAVGNYVAAAHVESGADKIIFDRAAAAAGRQC